MIIKYFGSPNCPVCRVAIIFLVEKVLEKNIISVSNFRQASNFHINYSCYFVFYIHTMQWDLKLAFTPLYKVLMNKLLGEVFLELN